MDQARNAALKAGSKKEACKLPLKAVEQDESNGQAWLWMSAAVETEKQRRTCSEKVLALDLGNEIARRGLASLNEREEAEMPRETLEPADDVEVAQREPVSQVLAGEEPTQPAPSVRGREPEHAAEARAKIHSANWKWAALGAGVTGFLFLIGCIVVYALGIFPVPGEFVQSPGPKHDTAIMEAPNGGLLATITYPTQLKVGDYGHITVEMKNQGTTGWTESDDYSEDRSPTVWIESLADTGYYFKALSVVSMEPVDNYGSNVNDDGSSVYRSLEAVPARGTVRFRMELMATTPGVFRALVRAGPGPLSSGWIEYEIRTIVNPE